MDVVLVQNFFFLYVQKSPIPFLFRVVQRMIHLKIALFHSILFRLVRRMTHLMELLPKTTSSMPTLRMRCRSGSKLSTTRLSQ